ncbi:hypothetical protein JCM24511_02051 [Saitozyma sp. JCM 24511]|nr:hypothetical protein JCM24511_02051 [Saitozyma sp. JCM 24511]
MSLLKLTGCFASQLAIPASPRPVPSEMGHLEKNIITYSCVKTTSTLDTVAFGVLEERDKDNRCTQRVSPLSSPPPYRPPHRRRPTAIPGEVDDIPFTFSELARLTMTPLRHRLLHLSQQKLDRVEPPVGSREAGTSLWKVVLVREAVSTWRSIVQCPAEGMTDWCKTRARTLRVICKEEEKDEEQQMEVQEEEGPGRAWFEELLANMGQDEYSCDDGRKAEWTESSVSRAVYDDLEHQAEGMVAYTIPLPLSRP